MKTFLKFSCYIHNSLKQYCPSDDFKETKINYDYFKLIQNINTNKD